ncbi:MAG: YitT family protein, partial [Clostridia bacterium]|nr:YitT family protein [Clostridia bacterium]
MKNMKRLTDYGVILIGLIMIAFSVSTLIVPNKIIQGGVSGLSAIIYYITGVPVSVLNLVINIILIIFGLKILGKKFIINTIVCVFILSGFIEIFSWLPPITDDMFLATVFGAAIYGMGIGFTLLKGASSGGTDILGRICQYFLPHISIGRLLLIVDGTIILLGYIIFRNVELVMYGVL